MEKIHIVADSAADIPQALCQRYAIEIIPVSVTYGGRTIREYYDITPEQYWDVLTDSPEIPTTAQISLTDCLSTFLHAKNGGCTHVLAILMNGAGSGGYQSACIARDMFYEEHGRDMVIELIDSRTYSYVYGRIAVQCARMRERGSSFAAILATAQDLTRCVQAYLGVFNLRHLRKSGRISGGAAFVGDKLGLRPISHVIDGGVDVCDKVRGDKNLMPRLARLALETAVRPGEQTAHLLYAKVSPAYLDQLEQLLLTGGFAGVERYPIGAAVTTNAGPNSLAVSFIGPMREPPAP